MISKLAMALEPFSPKWNFIVVGLIILLIVAIIAAAQMRKLPKEEPKYRFNRLILIVSVIGILFDLFAYAVLSLGIL
ncbi:MAG: hypothetical protein QW589_01830 [Candidatus Bathyarchaeia archaeon]